MSAIRCGHCKQYHDTIQAVRECSMGRGPIGTVLTTEPPEEAPEPLTEGIYTKNDQVYKVIESQNGRLYAKMLVVANGDSNWEYAPGAARELSSLHRLTKEAAAQYGKITGICAMCGAKLTNEESIERGIGPICAEKF